MTQDPVVWDIIVQERSELRAENELLKIEVQRLREALQMQTEGIYEIIAEWANEEGIGFDQTERLSKALGLKAKP